MGNRAIITFENEYKNNGSGLYLHWSGGRDSVEAFITYARLTGTRCDSSYGLARLAQIIGNFFGGTLSLGIVPARCGAGDDNGVYIIGDNWKIIGREEIGEGFHEQNEYDLIEMLHSINEAQPEQFKPEILNRLAMLEKYPISYEEKLELIRDGSDLYINTEFESPFEYRQYHVLGFGHPGEVVNGHDVEGIPYINRRHYPSRFLPAVPDEQVDRKNINNYILENTRFVFA